MTGRLPPQQQVCSDHKVNIWNCPEAKEFSSQPPAVWCGAARLIATRVQWLRVCLLKRKAALPPAALSQAALPHALERVLP